MNILVIGSGAREHALCWKLSNSSVNPKVFIWPGNVVSCDQFDVLNISKDADFSQLHTEIKAKNIELVVCGPEQPLADGLSDYLQARNIPVFGPCKEVAQLESSKSYAKKMMQDAGIPTASYHITRNKEECTKVAQEMLKHEGGTVLKASGLAGGKGVFVCFNEAELKNGLSHLYDSDMKSASTEVVVESVLRGRECSFFTFIGDGGYTSLGFAVDFKRLKESDEGPNTGGMGCYTPVPWLPHDAADIVNKLVTEPLLKCLEEKGLCYRGCLYIGLMWGENGPSVVEFNIRLGDPEAQILAFADDRDWLPLIAEKCGVKLSKKFEHTPYNPSKKVVGITMASAGYPYEKNTEVVELDATFFRDEQTTKTFAASVLGKDSKVLVGSGRILTVVANGDTFTEARKISAQKAQEIAKNWPGCQWRKDIAERVAVEEK